jgi:hypothetical protein
MQLKTSKEADATLMIIREISPKSRAVRFSMAKTGGA